MRTSLTHLLAAYVVGLGTTAQPAPLSAAEARQPTVPIAAYVTAAAQRFAIPEPWIYAIMRVESSRNPRAVSPKGATGLMQIMPSTWMYLRARYGLAEDIYDPRENILAGAAYMRELYDRYGAPGFLAAYNAGPPRYEAYLNSGRALPAETIDYVARLAPITGGALTKNNVAPRSDPSAWLRSAVFISNSGTPSVASETASFDSAHGSTDIASVGRQPPRPSLFVSLSGQHSR